MLDDRKEKCQSPLEERFLSACCDVGLLVELQYEIGKIHADFAVVDKKIAIECDSRQYHSSSEAYENDLKRNRVYEKHEWNVLRLTGNAIMQDPEGIAMAIKLGQLYCGTVTMKVDDYSRFNDNLPFLPRAKEEKQTKLTHISSFLKQFPQLRDEF